MAIYFIIEFYNNKVQLNKCIGTPIPSTVFLNFFNKMALNYFFIWSDQ